MSIVEFIFKGKSSKIYCKPKEKMQDILSRYATKVEKDLNFLYFLFEGKIINKGLTLSETTKNNSIIILVYETNEIEIKENKENLINLEKIKSKYIRCPECNENITLNFIDNKINLFNCRNGHEFKNILLNEFENTQIYDMSSIKCQNCSKTKFTTSFNEFYKCIKCQQYLCPLCKTIHDKSHEIINLDKNYLCHKHNEPYSIYCSDCRINSCVQCFNEKHKNHKNIFFGDIIPDIDDINNKMKDLKKCIDLFKQNIEEIKSKLNSIVNNFEIYYKINEEIINNYKSRERNYEILKNVNQISNSSIHIINKLNDINNDNDIMDKLNKIFNIYKIMNTKEETNDEIVMKYHISKNDKKINIFGTEFVKKNKYLCKIINDNKEYELTDDFEIENNNNNYLEIKLKGLKNITDMSHMFYNCSSLLSVINKDNFDFKNINNMSSAFLGCSLLNSLSTFKEINTSNVTNMSFLFSLCSKLDLSFVNNWDTSNVTDMCFMFSGCFNNSIDFAFSSKEDGKTNDSKIYSLIKEEDLKLSLDTRNVVNMSGMFSGCLTLKCLAHIDLSNVKNMSQIFRGCKSLILESYNKDLNFSNVKDLSGMFLNCSSLNTISNWNFENAININYLFSFCESLEKIDKLNTSNVIDISNLFHGCNKLKSILELNIDTSNVIDMSRMFKKCSSLTDISVISNFNTKNMKYINSMFDSCEKLKSLPNLNWDTNNMIDMSCLFKYCSQLNSTKEISKFNTENVKNMSQMFYRCEKLSSLDGLKNWNTLNVTDMSYMFNFCYSLSDFSPLKNWNTENVKNMSNMFSYCRISNLSLFSNWNTKNVTNMNSMFKQYPPKESHSHFYTGNIAAGLILYAGQMIYNKFTDINCLSNLAGLEKWDTSNVEDMREMFFNCSKIKTFSPLSNWNIEKANIEKIFESCDLKIPDNFQNKINQLKNKNN